MIAIVNEPQAEYKVSRWPKDVSFVQNERHIEIKGDRIVVQQQSNARVFTAHIGIKKRLSSLRGKLPHQDEKIIDEQIKKMRDEWERNI